MDKLQARGGQEQLIMFLTGPAGSGKSTAVRVAEQFCYEFYIALYEVPHIILPFLTSILTNVLLWFLLPLLTFEAHPIVH